MTHNNLHNAPKKYHKGKIAPPVSTFRLKRIAGLAAYVCQNWKELCAEINNCPLLGQEKWDDYCAHENLSPQGESFYVGEPA